MELNHHHPDTYEELSKLILGATSGAESIVFQAGHFLLTYDEGNKRIFPCILGDPSYFGHAPHAQAYGQFPLFTWKLAFRILGNLQIPSKYVMTVVNDWQYLPKHVRRSDFYLSQQGRLPESFRQVIDESLSDPPIQILEPEPINNGVSTAPFFGEMNLRNRYHNRVSKLIKKGALPPDAVTENTDEGIVCKLPDPSGNLVEIYCNKKTGDCTAEIAEMLTMAAERTQATHFINFYPSVCREFVEQGTARAYELFKAPLRTVLNVGLPSSSISSEEEMLDGCEVSEHKFPNL